MPMSPTAKAALAATIRALRARLLDDLRAEAEGRYRLRLPAEEAGLPAREGARRARIEEWIREQQRAELASGRKGGARPTDAFWRELEEQAASTLLNRLVVLRLMEANVDEAPPLRQPPVLTGGWQSRGYADLRALAPALARGDETEGYAFLLQLIFDELAADLPGIFGPVGLTALLPVPAATLRHLVNQLDQPALAPCWTDEMTLGWVYQYWNDPAREALDAKINAGGKIEPHEIASKTQMFTERYMVDWLLQNSLGPLWLAICENNGWVPRVVADGTLDRLEARRTAWRAQRAAGTVAPTDLMPLHSPDERRWAYLVPAPAGARPPASALRSIRDLRLIDPAVGSGHFLVVALDLLLALHEEEAAHQGHPFSPVAAVEHIIESSLHGVDLDPRAVQIAAAAVYLCAQQRARGARPAQMNLVASTLRLARLPPKDPAIAALRQAVQAETGVPAALIDQLVAELAGADHLGSLLRVDEALDAAIAAHEATLGKVKPEQIKLFDRPAAVTPRVRISAEKAKATVIGQLEAFLADHTSADDLGLRLAGEQLAAGVRFVRLIKPGAYDVVVANPPYQGTGKMAEAAFIERNYPLGKADLYAAFLLRGLELAKPGGLSAMLTMRNWMFIKQYAGLREHLLERHGLCALGDFDRGAFEGIPDEVVSVTVGVFIRDATTAEAVALCPTPREDRSRDSARTDRKRAATLCQEGRHAFDPAALKVVPDWPLVYWWDAEMLRVYQSAPLIGRCAPVVKGLTTCDDTRFVRCFWEPAIADVATGVALTSRTASRFTWSPFVNGAKGEAWLDSPRLLVKWRLDGIQIAHAPTNRYGRGQKYYFRRGIAFTQIGSDFTARAHHFPSVLGNKGSSVVPTDLAAAVCAMNSTRAREILSSLNPGIGFEVGDVNRLPLFPIDGADAIFAQVESAFGVHEAHREPSVEFRRPGPSPWRAAQAWAQQAVDRPAGAPLPPFTEALDPEPPTDHLSFALGVALGRFGAPGSGQEGPLDPDTADLRAALPHGLLFLDQTYGEGDHRDDLGHPAAAPLHAAWAAHAPAIGAKKGLRAWLADELFGVHRAMYDNRPIHWPLSSAQRTFVAWVNIHRMGPQTLRVLLADHLAPARARLDGALADLRAARDGADKKASKQAEKALEKLIKQRDELAAFTAAVEACADAGPPPPDAKCPPREVDARYAPELDDGVMINSAALWPLLDAQWKDPKKWWVELATAKDRKDYDWAQLARRYWPSRVAAKCAADPSLAVAHGSFWRLHPARAWAWELRLQDELGLGGPTHENDAQHATPAPRAEGWAGRITEADTQGDEAPHRAAYLRDHGPQAIEAVEREATRRMGRGAARRVVPRLTLLEAGLWSAHPTLVWAAELRLISRQGADLRIESPDEAQARAALLAAEPHRIGERAAVLRAAQEHQAALFAAAEAVGEGEGEEDSAGGDEEEEG